MNPRNLAIYGPIGPGGMTAESFRAKLQALGAGAVTLRINSPGGDVFEALSIFNQIRAHGNVHVIVDGLAASAASYIALAAKRVSIAREAMLMIHAPLSAVAGHADDLREQAELLDKVSGQIASIYATRTGKAPAEIQAWFADGDKWFTAAEALAAGLVDEVLADEAVTTFAHAFHFASAPASIAAKLDPVTILQTENARLSAELEKARVAVAAARVTTELGQATIKPEAHAALVKTFLTDEAGALAVISGLKSSAARSRGVAPVHVAPGVEGMSGGDEYRGYMQRLSNRR